MPKLLIVESPNKVKKLAAYLQEIEPGAWKVAATVGHFRGLPDMKGQPFEDVVDTASWDENFVVQKKDVARKLGSLVKGADVYLAADDDREGEAIAWHVVQEFGARSAKRVVLTEITKTALTKAINQTREVDHDLVEAQRARAVLDYAFGMLVSRRLWRFGAKSAGRVQSAALRILIDRETAITDFKSVPYWTVSATYAEGFTAKLASFERPSDEELDDEGEDADAAPRLTPKKLPTAEEATRLVAELNKCKHRVQSVDEKPGTRAPPKPYETSTLYQDASKRLGFKPDKTAKVAQKLFEQGLITYIRTDSVVLADEAVEDIRGVIERKHPDALPDQPPKLKAGKGAQAAHEAIRPVKMDNPAAAPLKGDEQDLYALIWLRTLLSQCKPAATLKTVVTVEPVGMKVRLLASGVAIKEAGWLAVEAAYRQKAGPKAKDAEPSIPLLKEGQPLDATKIASKAAKTQPPPRFTAASLIAYLKRKQIGRPATLAGIFSVLIERRKYVAERKKKLFPTELGQLADRLTRGSFGTLTQEGFTAATEKSLDKIADGKLRREDFLGKFWARFTSMIEEADAFLDYYAKRHPELDQDAAKVHDKPCPLCGSEVHVLKGKYGAYARCTADSCSHRENLEPLKASKQPCPECGGRVVEQPYRKEGKSKKFYRCETCTWRSSSAPPKPHKRPCAECGGQVVEVAYKKDGQARSFFKCSGCDWKGSTPAPTQSAYRCVAHAEHGPMFEYSGTSKKGNAYTYWQCHVCRDAAGGSGDAGKTWSPVVEPVCPECGKQMAFRAGKKGSFFGCTAYPDCRATLPFDPSVARK